MSNDAGTSADGASSVTSEMPGEPQASQHEHVFETGQAPRTIVWCDGFPQCHEMRVVGKRGGLRELTPQEKINVLDFMLKEVAMAEAMIMIHGKERGIARFNYLRRGGPPA